MRELPAHRAELYRASIINDAIEGTRSSPLFAKDIGSFTADRAPARPTLKLVGLIERVQVGKKPGKAEARLATLDRLHAEQIRAEPRILYLTHAAAN
jgi:hypothetical protein